MPQLPNLPSPGEQPSVSWARQLFDAVRSLRIIAGPGLVSHQTTAGTTLALASALPKAGSARLVPADVCPAVVTGDEGVPGVYRVSLHPNGIGGPGAGSATVSMTEFGPEQDIPSGTVVLAHAIAIAAAEDGEDD
jgi:hypothetical protein